MTGSNNTNSDIARKAAHGVFWNFLAFGLSKGLVLLTLAILARLLTKDSFGLVAVALVAINYLSIVKDLGLGVALIQRRGDIEEAADTVFTLNLVVGFILTLVVFPIAPYVASYFADPQITPILRWLGVSFLINAIGAVHMVRLRRELDFRRKLIPDMGNAIVKGVVSISMAFSGFGVWSLVFGQLAGALVSTVIVWLVFPWRPRISVNRSLAKGLLKYGVSVMGIDALSIIAESLASIIVGRFFGMALLGVYSLAYRLPEMLVISNLWVMGAVVFPVFSAIQDQAEDIRKGLLATIRIIEMIATPVCLGLIVAADPIIRVFFGEQWLDTIPILRILAIHAWIYSIGFHFGDIYKAIGRPDILLKLSILTIVIVLPGLLIGAGYGLTGIALGYLIAMGVSTLVELLVATKFIEVTLFDILSQLKPALQSGIALTALALPALYLTENLNPFLQLLIVITFGATGYLGVLWHLEKENLLHLVNLVRKSK